MYVHVYRIPSSTDFYSGDVMFIVKICMHGFSLQDSGVSS